MGNLVSLFFWGFAKMPKGPSYREELRLLILRFPDWTYKQYAERLGKNEESVRSVASKMGMAKKRGRPSNLDLMKNLKPRTKKPKPEPPRFIVASKAMPSRSGYLKLM